ncbi:MAG: hypothetical protein Q4G69_06120 [Planctomycetia bacterium]|nr:hypothetical protein [Planctomycetia bacterium]
MNARSEIPVWRRRQGRKGFCRNAFLWGFGNGLVSTSLVIYIIRSLNPPAGIGLAITWIIAAPRLIGILRILTPVLIDWVGSRRRVCLIGSILSPLILLTLPLFLLLGFDWARLHSGFTMVLIGVIWGLYHLIEYFSTVSLWSWMGDYVPDRIRVRFLARRERSMIAGQFPGMLAAGLYTWARLAFGVLPEDRWQIYLLPAFCGIFSLIAAAFPLWNIADVPWKRISGLKERILDLIAPLRSKSFRALILFGAWIQIANGLTQGPQSVFQMNVLGITMLTALALQSWTRIGQMLFAGSAGRLLARFDQKKIMGISLFLTAAGPLFYFIADRNSWYLVFASATLWIAWIGINIGMNNLILSLAPEGDRSSWIAVYFITATLAFGISVLIGGWILDHFGKEILSVPRIGFSCDYCRFSFLYGSLLRFLGIFFLWRIAFNVNSK